MASVVNLRFQSPREGPFISGVDGLDTLDTINSKVILLVSVPIALRHIWDQRPVSLKAADAIYATLRQGIVSGLLRAGDRFNEEPLAEQFGVSRTPVREAMHRLEAEQLLARGPRRGLVVRGVDAQQLTEVYMLRIALDSMASSLAAKKKTPVSIAKLNWINAQMREAAVAGDVSAVAERNIEFHETICEIAGNSMLTGFVEQLHDWVRRAELSPFMHPGRSKTGTREHDEIIAAIEAGKADLAESLMRRHMQRSHEVRLELLKAETALLPSE